MKRLNLRLITVVVASILSLFSTSPVLAYSYGYKDAGVCKWSDAQCLNLEY